MPLFMDRHDVPTVTAEQVAQAHMADLEMGAKFGVQFLAYWFDADQGEAFCLAKAPTGDSLTAVHKATHGLIPNEIISVSEDNVLRLLGRMSETGSDTPGVNPFRTILFTDLEGSTSMLEAVGQSAFMVLLDRARPDHPTRAGGSTWTRGEAHGRRDHGRLRRRRERAGMLDGDPGRVRGALCRGPRHPNFGYGSGSPPANPLTTTTTCSARRSRWRAGSVAQPMRGASSPPTSFATWAASEASRSTPVATWC